MPDSQQASVKLREDGMEIDAAFVRRKELGKYLDKELLDRERKSADAHSNSSSANRTKRRIGIGKIDSQQQQTQSDSGSKRNRTDDSVNNNLYAKSHLTEDLMSSLCFYSLMKVCPQIHREKHLPAIMSRPIQWAIKPMPIKQKQIWQPMFNVYCWNILMYFFRISKRKIKETQKSKNEPMLGSVVPLCIWYVSLDLLHRFRSKLVIRSSIGPRR